MQSYLTSNPIVFSADATWPFVAVVLFALIVLLLAAAIKRSKPRPELNVVRSDPPTRHPDDPTFIRRRARAAAAVIVYHRKRHASGELHENR